MLEIYFRDGRNALGNGRSEKAYLALELTERFVTCTCIFKKMTVLM